MEKSKGPTPDYYLLLISFFLVFFGLLMVFSSSFVLSTQQFGNYSVYFKKQLTYAMVGFVFMFIFYKMNYKRLKTLSFPILLFSIILLILPLVPGVGVEAGGAKRWINIFGFQVQPSEFMKLAVILYLASTISQRINYIKKFQEGIIPYLPIIGVIVLITIKQKSLSTVIIITGLFLFLLYIAGIKYKHLFALLAIFLVGAAFFTAKEPYRAKRIMGFADQGKDIKNTNYQIQQSFIALGVGGINGVGIGQSRQKFLFLPQPHTDFIFSIIGEELGIKGTLFVLLLFILFAFRGFRISLLSRDYFGFLLAGGITFQIIFQAMINLGSVSGCLPVTGIPLPFISYGGSSLVATLSAVGILLSISKYSVKV